MTYHIVMEETGDTCRQDSNQAGASASAEARLIGLWTAAVASTSAMPSGDAGTASSERAIAVQPSNSSPAQPARQRRADRLDLLQSRRALLLIRSRCCDDASLVRRINRLISQTAYLCEPASTRQDRRIRRAIVSLVHEAELRAPLPSTERAGILRAVLAGAAGKPHALRATRRACSTMLRDA